MTREEATKYARSKKMMLELLIYNDDCKYVHYAMYSDELSFINAVISALRHISWEQDEYAVYSAELSFINAILSALQPVSREQVEKVWRGEWEWYDEEVGSPLEGIERDWGWRCSKCKVVLPDDFDDPDNPPAMRFCQWCGAPMTDEAVQMVMERLEALYEAT